jgi:hypothetical protein
MIDKNKIPLILLLFFLLAIATRVYLYRSIGYTADDALITLRYAENLSQGKGFVYNENEKVLGTTTPFLALITALLLQLKINGILAFFGLNLIADLFTAFLLFRIFQNESPVISIIPPVLFLFNPETVQWSLSGMETQISIAFIFGAIYFSSENRWNLAFVMAAFAVWTRIDGIAIAVALTAVYVFRYKRFPLLPVLLLIGILAPWILFATFYFGSPIPNSAIAKASLGGSDYFHAFKEILFRGFLHLHSFGAPFFLLAVIGTWHIGRQKRELLVLPIWTWGYAFSYTLAAGAMHPWYYAPFYAGYLALTWAGLVYLIQRIPLLQKAVVSASIGVIAILIVLSLSYRRAERLQEMQAQLYGINGRVGLWMKENSPPNAVFAVKDIGYTGYYSRRKMLDLAGLVSPETISFRSRADFLGPIQKFHPDYFAFSAGQIRNLKLNKSGLMKDYEVAHVIQNRSGSYTIFRLKRSKTERS